MKTLDEIKDEYAIEHGYLFWNHLLKNSEWEKILIAFDEVNILSQQQALKNASDRVKIVKTGNSGSYFDASVDKQSILNEQNIVR